MMHKLVNKSSSELVGREDLSDNSLAPPFTKKQLQSLLNESSQFADDSFTEVTHRRSRRENKQMAKEKL